MKVQSAFKQKRKECFLPRLFIFDLDGTLADAYPAIVESFQASMKAFGYSVQTPGKIRKAVGWGDRKLLEPFVRPADLDQALAFYKKHHARALTRGSFWMPEAKSLLASLCKKRIKTAIASNRPSAFTAIILKHLGMDRLLDAVACADLLRYKKPHPWAIRKILKQLSVKPGQTVYVGDMAIDVEAGRRAGVRTAGVATGSSSVKELKRANPDYLFQDLNGLKTCFLKTPDRS